MITFGPAPGRGSRAGILDGHARAERCPSCRRPGPLRASRRQPRPGTCQGTRPAHSRVSRQRTEGPGGQPGNDSAASAAGLHPERRLFGQATPGPGHHPTTAASNPAPGPVSARGRAGHSPVAANLPPAKPHLQAERPQRNEDERPEGAARRRAHSAARKARGQGSLVKPQRPKGTSQAAKKTDGTP